MRGSSAPLADAQVQTTNYNIAYEPLTYLKPRDAHVKRVHFSHVMTNVKMLENPIEALSLLVENSVQAGAKLVQVRI